MNIPETILNKVRIAMKLQPEAFESYLKDLEAEGKVYVKSFILDQEAEETVINLCVQLYVQYQLFSKIEYEEISQDKLETLHSIINTQNSVYQKKNQLLAKGARFI